MDQHPRYPVPMVKRDDENLPRVDPIPVITVPILGQHRPESGMTPAGLLNLSDPSATARSQPERVTSKTVRGPRNSAVVHPYARLHGNKEEGKRRKVWTHALENHIFTPYELSTLGAPHRRTIYAASLEAHIDELHNQLLGFGFWPVAFEELDTLKGLNTKTAKSMVAGLQYDASLAKLKLFELQRTNDGLERELLQDGSTPL
ncbi:hypothetical protein VNI00_001532 [Paramarasmius palmivorus]|uniref:SAM domain-containing protein n=1 Tax=Paramarasmius palmivorus TaxID=297713 RepID=A0AAW0E5G9_9AGAR